MMFHRIDKRISRHRFFLPRIVAAVLCATVSSGCWGSEAATPPEETPLNEIQTTEVTAIGNAGELELLSRGKRYFDSRVFGEAKKAFQGITTNFPLGPYAAFAAVKYADAVFELRDFNTAAGLYLELHKNHPGAEFSSYALFRAARSHHLAQHGLGRDDTALQKAVKEYDELLKKFPDSQYSEAAAQYRAEAHAALAAYEESIAEFYRKRQKDDAAAAREAAYHKKWRPVLEVDAANDAKDEALQREELSRIASELQSADILLRTAPIADHVAPVETPPSETPDSECPTGKSCMPNQQEAAAHNIEGAEPVQPTTERHVFAPSPKHRVSRIDCREDTGLELILYLDREFSNETVLNVRRSIEGLSVQLPETGLTPAEGSVLSQQCSDGTTIVVSHTGLASVQTARYGQVLTIGNPPRVIFTFE